MCKTQGPDIIVHQPDEVLDNMNEWCKEQHGKVIIISCVCEYGVLYMF